MPRLAVHTKVVGPNSKALPPIRIYARIYPADVAIKDPALSFSADSTLDTLVYVLAPE
jgi:hypothetical protein